MTKKQLLETMTYWADRVYAEAGTSYEEMLDWTPQQLYDAYFPYSGTVYSFEPVFQAFVAAGLVAVTLGAALGALSEAGYSISKVAETALNSAVRAGTYSGIRLGIKLGGEILDVPGEGSDFTATQSDVEEWLTKLVKATTPDIDQTPEEYASNYVAREEALRIARLKQDIANNVVDINRDGKLDVKDKALIAKYGSVGAAIEALYGLPAERAVDIPGEGGTSSDLVVLGEGDYTDDVSYEIGFGGAVRRRDGSPRGAAVSGYPKPSVERGEQNMAYYNRGYGQYNRGQYGQKKWVTVAPGTPGAFPSKINPGQWITRRRY